MKQKTIESQAFHLQEYNSLRQELLSLVDQINQVEKYVVIGTAAIYSWLAVNSSDAVPLQFNLFWFIPMLFTMLGSMKVYMLKSGVMKIGNYIYDLEYVFGAKDAG